jgi:hypothetical protein
VKLPPPFDNASDVQADAHGAISLIDQQGKSLARLPLSTAFELSTESEDYCSSYDGTCYGASYGTCYGDGYGDGDCYGDGIFDGSGRGKSK